MGLRACYMIALPYLCSIFTTELSIAFFILIDFQSDLCAYLSAHRLKSSPLSKIKLWEGEEYRHPLAF
jgi:hypothetical protein